LDYLVGCLVVVSVFFSSFLLFSFSSSNCFVNIDNDENVRKINNKKMYYKLQMFFTNQQEKRKGKTEEN